VPSRKLIAQYTTRPISRSSIMTISGLYVEIRMKYSKIASKLFQASNPFLSSRQNFYAAVLPYRIFTQSARSVRLKNRVNVVNHHLIIKPHLTPMVVGPLGRCFAKTMTAAHRQAYYRQNKRK
jgi:hypothetical protein